MQLKIEAVTGIMNDCVKGLDESIKTLVRHDPSLIDVIMSLNATAAALDTLIVLLNEAEQTTKEANHD